MFGRSRRERLVDEYAGSSVESEPTLSVDGYYKSNGEGKFDRNCLVRMGWIVGLSLVGLMVLGGVLVGGIMLLGVSNGGLKVNGKNSNEYLWIDSDVGMDDMFAMQILLIEMNRQKLQNNLVLSSLSSVYGMTPNTTNGREIIGNMLKINEMDEISKGREFQIVKGLNFGLKDNLEKFRFEDASWYSNVDQKQNNFLQKTGLASHNQLIDRTRELEEIYQFEPTFTYFNNRVAQLEKLPDNSLTILAIGPLTNIAVWLRNNPSKLEIIKRKVRRIVSMGGNAIFSNNSDMEWNYHCDAKSVQVVMETFSEKFFMIGLDVANEQAISNEQLVSLQQLLSKKRVDSNHRKTASLLYDLLALNPVACTYDPITASYLIRPELFTFEQVKVNIELSSTLEEPSFAGRVHRDSSLNGIKINVANSFNNIMYYNYLYSLFSSL